MSKTHYATWKDGPQGAPVEIEVSCGWNPDRYPNFWMARNWDNVSCARCLKKRPKKEKRK